MLTTFPRNTFRLLDFPNQRITVLKENRGVARYYVVSCPAWLAIRFGFRLMLNSQKLFGNLWTNVDCLSKRMFFRSPQSDCRLLIRSIDKDTSATSMRLIGGPMNSRAF